MVYYIYSVFAFGFLAGALFFKGYNQGSYLARSDEHVLSFHRPRLMRLGSGMCGLLFLAGAVFIVFDPNHIYSGQSDVSFKWIMGVMLPFVASFFFFMANPQEVRVDLDTRLCHQTSGWILRPKQRTAALTGASLVGVIPSQIYIVTLMIGGGKNCNVTIGQFPVLPMALAFAQEMGNKLHLPFQQITEADLISLS